MKSLVLSAMLVFFSSCQPPEESPFRETAQASAGNMAPSRWSPNAFPLKIKVSDSFSADEDEAIRFMASAWSHSIGDKTQFMDAAYTTSEIGSKSLSTYEDGTIGVYKLTQWPSTLPTTALAITQIIGSRKNGGSANEYIQIEHADIFLNYEIYDFTTDGSWGYDLQTIVLHEMGHMLGLYHDHSSTEESVMYPSITRYVENRYPKERDIQTISAKYDVERSSSNFRALAGESDTPQESLDIPDEDLVVVQYELMADGSEKFVYKDME